MRVQVQIAVVSLVLVGGCSRMEVDLAPRVVGRLDGRTHAMVIAGRDTFYLLDAKAVGDSIIGRDATTRGYSRMAVPLAGVQAIGVRRFNATDTAVLILGLSPFGAWLLFLILMSGGT